MTTKTKMGKTTNRSIARDLLCNHVGKLVGHGHASNLEHLASYLLEDENRSPVAQAILSTLSSGAELYPWQADVFGEVFNRPGDLLVECVASEKILFVKDSAAVGADGVWAVETKPIGEPSNLMRIFRGLPYKSFSAHYTVEGKTVCIRAINIKSCNRNRNYEER